MKKFTFLCLFAVYAGLAAGQGSVDVLLKARALNQAGQPDQSLKLINGAISGSTDNRFYLERAESYLLKGDYSAAISDFNESNRINPGSGEFGLAKAYAKKGDAATSLYHLEINLKSQFRKGEKEIVLDPAFGSIDNRQEWRQFWKKEWYTPSEKALSEIQYYISSNKLDESKGVLTDLKMSNGDDDQISYAEALVNLAYGKFPEVIRTATELNAKEPENENYLRLLAKAQAGNSDPSGSSSTYTRLIDKGVDDAELLLQRAECYGKTGETDKSLADIKRYLSIYPNNTTAISMAGKAEAKSGDNLGAIEYFSENLKLHPNDPQCYIDRGNSYLVAKSWDMAVNDYSMSLDLKPGNSDVWLNKGIALLNSGKVQDACHDFRKAFSLGNRKVSDYISRNCLK